MVRFAYRNVFSRLGQMLDLGWIMLLALLVVLIVPGVLFPDRYGGGNKLHLGALDYAQGAIALLSLSAFAVRWYQSILVGDPHRQPPRAFFRGWARFLIYGCLAYLAIGVVATIAVAVLSRFDVGTAANGAIELAAIVAGILLALGLLRFGLLFPAAARGEPLGPVTAWRLMRGNAWRLALASILTALPITVIAGLLSAIVIMIAMPQGSTHVANPPPGLAILIGLIETVANMLLVALGASLLSGFYRALVTLRNNGFPPPDQR